MKRPLKIISWILIAAFLAQDIAWANPDLATPTSQSTLQIPSQFNLWDPELYHKNVLKLSLKYFLYRYPNIDFDSFDYPITPPAFHERNPIDGVKLVFAFDKKHREGDRFVVPCYIGDEKERWPAWAYEAVIGKDGYLFVGRPGERENPVTPAEPAKTPVPEEEAPSAPPYFGRAGKWLLALNWVIKQGLHAETPAPFMQTMTPSFGDLPKELDSVRQQLAARAKSGKLSYLKVDPGSDGIGTYLTHRYFNGMVMPLGEILTGLASKEERVRLVTFLNKPAEKVVIVSGAVNPAVKSTTATEEIIYERLVYAAAQEFLADEHATIPLQELALIMQEMIHSDERRMAEAPFLQEPLVRENTGLYFLSDALGEKGLDLFKFFSSSAMAEADYDRIRKWLQRPVFRALMAGAIAHIAVRVKTERCLIADGSLTASEREILPTRSIAGERHALYLLTPQLKELQDADDDFAASFERILTTDMKNLKEGVDYDRKMHTGFSEADPEVERRSRSVFRHSTYSYSARALGQEVLGYKYKGTGFNATDEREEIPILPGVDFTGDLATKSPDESKMAYGYNWFSYSVREYYATLDMIFEALAEGRTPDRIPPLTYVLFPGITVKHRDKDLAAGAIVFGVPSKNDVRLCDLASTRNVGDALEGMGISGVHGLKNIEKELGGRVMPLLSRIGGALQGAHRRGHIHSTFTPENIAYLPQEDRLNIVDWESHYYADDIMVRAPHGSQVDLLTRYQLLDILLFISHLMRKRYTSLMKPEESVRAFLRGYFGEALYALHEEEIEKWLIEYAIQQYGNTLARMAEAPFPVNSPLYRILFEENAAFLKGRGMSREAEKLPALKHWPKSAIERRLKGILEDDYFSRICAAEAFDTEKAIDAIARLELKPDDHCILTGKHAWVLAILLYHLSIRTTIFDTASQGALTARAKELPLGAGVIFLPDEKKTLCGRLQCLDESLRDMWRAENEGKVAGSFNTDESLFTEAPHATTEELAPFREEIAVCRRRGETVSFEAAMEMLGRTAPGAVHLHAALIRAAARGVQLTDEDIGKIANRHRLNDPENQALAIALRPGQGGGVAGKRTPEREWWERALYERTNESLEKRAYEYLFGDFGKPSPEHVIRFYDALRALADEEAIEPAAANALYGMIFLHQPRWQPYPHDGSVTQAFDRTHTALEKYRIIKTDASSALGLLEKVFASNDQEEIAQEVAQIILDRFEGGGAGADEQLRSPLQKAVKLVEYNLVDEDAFRAYITLDVLEVAFKYIIDHPAHKDLDDLVYLFTELWDFGVAVGYDLDPAVAGYFEYLLHDTNRSSTQKAVRFFSRCVFPGLTDRESILQRLMAIVEDGGEDPETRAKAFSVLRMNTPHVPIEVLRRLFETHAGPESILRFDGPMPEKPEGSPGVVPLLTLLREMWRGKDLSYEEMRWNWLFETTCDTVVYAATNVLDDKKPIDITAISKECTRNDYAPLARLIYQVTGTRLQAADMRRIFAEAVALTVRQMTEGEAPGGGSPLHGTGGPTVLRSVAILTAAFIFGAPASVLVGMLLLMYVYHMRAQKHGRAQKAPKTGPEQIVTVSAKKKAIEIGKAAALVAAVAAAGKFFLMDAYMALRAIGGAGLPASTFLLALVIWSTGDYVNQKIRIMQGRQEKTDWRYLIRWALTMAVVSGIGLGYFWHDSLLNADYSERLFKVALDQGALTYYLFFPYIFTVAKWIVFKDRTFDSLAKEAMTRWFRTHILNLILWPGTLYLAYFYLIPYGIPPFFTIAVTSLIWSAILAFIIKEEGAKPGVFERNFFIYKAVSLTLVPALLIDTLILFPSWQLGLYYAIAVAWSLFYMHRARREVDREGALSLPAPPVVGREEPEAYPDLPSKMNAVRTRGTKVRVGVPIDTPDGAIDSLLVYDDKVFSPFDRSSEYLVAAAKENDLVKPGMKVLVVGCGSGYDTILAAAAGAEVDAIDIDDWAIAHTTVNLEECGLAGRARVFKHKGVEGLGQYDLILWNTPEVPDEAPEERPDPRRFMSRPEFETTMRELRKHITPDGAVCLRLFDKPYYQRVFTESKFAIEVLSVERLDRAVAHIRGGRSVVFKLSLPGPTVPRPISPVPLQSWHGRTMARRIFLGLAAGAGALAALELKGWVASEEPEEKEREYGLHMIGDFVPGRQTVVFTHGAFGGSPDDYRLFIERFSNIYNVATFSYDERQPLPAIAAALAGDIAALRKERGISGGLMLVANSYGTIVLREAVIHQDTSAQLFKEDTVIEIVPIWGGSRKAIGGSSRLAQGVVYIKDLLGDKASPNLAAACDPLGPIQGSLFNDGSCAAFRERTGRRLAIRVENDSHSPERVDDPEAKEKFLRLYNNGWQSTDVTVTYRVPGKSPHSEALKQGETVDFVGQQLEMHEQGKVPGATSDSGMLPTAAMAFEEHRSPFGTAWDTPQGKEAGRDFDTLAKLVDGEITWHPGVADGSIQISDELKAWLERHEEAHKKIQDSGLGILIEEVLATAVAFRGMQIVTDSHLRALLAAIAPIWADGPPVWASNISFLEGIIDYCCQTNLAYRRELTAVCERYAFKDNHDLAGFISDYIKKEEKLANKPLRPSLKDHIAYLLSNLAVIGLSIAALYLFGNWPKVQLVISLATILSVNVLGEGWWRYYGTVSDTAFTKMTGWARDIFASSLERSRQGKADIQNRLRLELLRSILSKFGRPHERRHSFEQLEEGAIFRFPGNEWDQGYRWHMKTGPTKYISAPVAGLIAVEFKEENISMPGRIVEALAPAPAESLPGRGMSFTGALKDWWRGRGKQLLTSLSDRWGRPVGIVAPGTVATPARQRPDPLAGLTAATGTLYYPAAGYDLDTIRQMMVTLPNIHTYVLVDPVYQYGLFDPSDLFMHSVAAVGEPVTEGVLGEGGRTTLTLSYQGHEVTVHCYAEDEQAFAPPELHEKADVIVVRNPGDELWGNLSWHARLVAEQLKRDGWLLAPGTNILAADTPLSLLGLEKIAPYKHIFSLAFLMHQFGLDRAGGFIPYRKVAEIEPLEIEDALYTYEGRGSPIRRFTRRLSGAQLRAERQVIRPPEVVRQDIAAVFDAAYGDEAYEREHGKKRIFLYEYEVYELCRIIGIEPPRYAFIRTPDEATIRDALKGLEGKQVVVKVVADDIDHKGKFGGVQFPKRDSAVVAGVFEAWQEKFKDQHFRGILVCEMVGHEEEYLVGGRFDEQFGPILVAGRGGSGVEEARDRAILPVPETADERAMFRIAIEEALYGKTEIGREISYADRRQFSRLAARIAGLFDLTGRYLITELDINPLVIDRDYAGRPLDGVLKFKIRDEADYFKAQPKARDLSGLFDPKRIAIVGSGRTARGLRDRLAANPNIESVQLIEGEADAFDPETDLVVIAKKRELAGALLEQIIEKKTTAQNKVLSAIIITGGFEESPTGKTAQENLDRALAKAREYERQGLLQLNVIGPNSLGAYTGTAGYEALFVPPSKLDTTKISQREGKRTAVISQSGGDVLSYIDLNPDVNINCIFSVGNTHDLGIADLFEGVLRHRGDDTDCIRIYLEGLDAAEGRRLASLIARATRPGDDGRPGKEVRIYIGGMGEAGKAAAKSHTAALSPARDVAIAALEAAGAVIETPYVDYPIDYEGLASRIDFSGERIAVVTNSGGEGVNSSEGIKKLAYAKFSDATTGILQGSLPDLCTVANPLDITGVGTDDHLVRALEAALADDNVDAAVVALALGAPLISYVTGEETIRDGGAIPRIVEIIKKSSKPVVLAIPGTRETWPGVFRYLDEHGIVYTEHAGQAVRVLETAKEQSLKKAARTGRQEEPPSFIGWFKRSLWYLIDRSGGPVGIVASGSGDGIRALRAEMAAASAAETIFERSAQRFFDQNASIPPAILKMELEQNNSGFNGQIRHILAEEMARHLIEKFPGTVLRLWLTGDVTEGLYVAGASDIDLLVQVKDAAAEEAVRGYMAGMNPEMTRRYEEFLGHRVRIGGGGLFEIRKFLTPDEDVKQENGSHAYAVHDLLSENTPLIDAIESPPGPRVSSGSPAPKNYRGSVIVVGGSASGYEALQEIISRLPPHHPPIIVAEHIPLTGIFSLEFERFIRASGRKIVVCQEPAKGRHETLYLEEDMIVVGRYLRMERDEHGYPVVRTYGGLDELPYDGVRAYGGIDHLFLTAAEQFGKKVLGVVTSGLAGDARHGSSAIVRRGGTILVQEVTLEEENAGDYVPDMPQSIVTARIPHERAPIKAMAERITILAPAKGIERQGSGAGRWPVFQKTVYDRLERTLQGRVDPYFARFIGQALAPAVIESGFFVGVVPLLLSWAGGLFLSTAPPFFVCFIACKIAWHFLHGRADRFNPVTRWITTHHVVWYGIWSLLISSTGAPFFILFIASLIMLHAKADAMHYPRPISKDEGRGPRWMKIEEYFPPPGLSDLSEKERPASRYFREDFGRFLEGLDKDFYERLRRSLVVERPVLRRGLPQIEDEDTWSAVAIGLWGHLWKREMGIPSSGEGAMRFTPMDEVDQLILLKYAYLFVDVVRSRGDIINAVASPVERAGPSEEATRLQGSGEHGTEGPAEDYVDTVGPPIYLIYTINVILIAATVFGLLGAGAILAPYIAGLFRWLWNLTANAQAADQVAPWLKYAVLFAAAEGGIPSIGGTEPGNTPQEMKRRTPYGGRRARHEKEEPAEETPARPQEDALVGGSLDITVGDEAKRQPEPEKKAPPPFADLIAKQEKPKPAPAKPPAPRLPLPVLADNENAAIARQRLAEQELRRLLLHDLTDAKTLTHDLKGLIFSLFKEKAVVFAFDSDVGRMQGNPVGIIIEAVNELKEDPDVAEALKNLVVLPPNGAENLSEDLKPYIAAGAEVFVFANNKNRSFFGEIERSVHPAYINETVDEKDFPAGAVYPLVQIVAITLAQYIDGKTVARLLEERDKLTAANIKNILQDPLNNGILIFDLLPEADEIDTQERMREYARLKHFLKAA